MNTIEVPIKTTQNYYTNITLNIIIPDNITNNIALKLFNDKLVQFLHTVDQLGLGILYTTDSHNYVDVRENLI